MLGLEELNVKVHSGVPLCWTNDDTPTQTTEADRDNLIADQVLSEASPLPDRKGPAEILFLISRFVISAGNF